MGFYVNTRIDLPLLSCVFGICIQPIQPTVALSQTSWLENNLSKDRSDGVPPAPKLGLNSLQRAKQALVVQWCFTSTETIRTVTVLGSGNPGRPPPLPHRSWALIHTALKVHSAIFSLSLSSHQVTWTVSLYYLSCDLMKCISSLYDHLRWLSTQYQENRCCCLGVNPFKYRSVWAHQFHSFGPRVSPRWFSELSKSTVDEGSWRVACELVSLMG